MRTLCRQMLLIAISIVSQQVRAAQDVAAAQPLVVFAAASLTDVLQQVGPQYTASNGVQIKFSFAASSALARQIESGARADVFLSADQEWMDYLAGRNLIDPRSRQNLLGNELVLVAPADSDVHIELASDAPLMAALGRNGRLATGDPDSVPAGRYARAALQSMNLWEALAPRLVRAENVRVALMYVARGEAPLGIVYATDAAVESRVKIVATFPEVSHPPITYPVAATTLAGPQARAFIDFLRGELARAAFTRAGFKMIAGAP